MYQLLRKALFLLPPEVSHSLALNFLKVTPKCLFDDISCNQTTIMGINFKHKIGLAAGVDVDGQYIKELLKLGFSFIEVGTLTPKPQFGNPKPRLFRLKSKGALINRMGFNNQGVDLAVPNLIKAQGLGVIGVNIGKNKDTPLNSAINDYLYCFRQVYKYASYITINISSPNTPELRQLQQGSYFECLIKTLRNEQLRLCDKYKKYVPIAIKISPDENYETLHNMADVIIENQIDAIIATNTTCKRDGVSNLKYANETGGLSGEPLFASSTSCIKNLKSFVGDSVVIIGVGGISSYESAKTKLDAGASLLQLYTGLIYNGPKLLSTLQKL